MGRVLLWSLLGLSLSANVAVGAIALRRSSGPGGVPAEPPLFSRVSLDAAQRARIVALREKLLADRAEQARRLAALRDRLASLLADDGVDRVAIDGTLAEIEERQEAYQRRLVGHVLAVRELLRPEQRAPFQALVAERMRTGAPLDPTIPWEAGKGARP